MAIETCIGMSVDLDFFNDDMCRQGISELQKEGIHIECQDENTIVIPFHLKPRDLFFFLRLGQRGIRWDQVEKLMDDLQQFVQNVLLEVSQNQEQIKQGGNKDESLTDG